jgi:hypothetical protein
MDGHQSGDVAGAVLSRQSRSATPVTRISRHIVSGARNKEIAGRLKLLFIRTRLSTCVFCPRAEVFSRLMPTNNH